MGAQIRLMQIHHALIPTAFLLSFSLSLGADLVTPPTPEPGGSPPVFARASEGQFSFDTGLLRGTLRAGGKSLGLSAVVHVPSGHRLDRGHGLLGHYRVFAEGVRYGGGAWDWPSEASLAPDGAVEVCWPAAQGRPFELRAVYRWRGPAMLDVETAVHAERDLAGFESFFASYFSERFTNAAVYVAKSAEHRDQPGFLPARASYGAWLMFPRDEAITTLIRDGRWKLEPNPVDWAMMPVLAQPVAWRRDPDSGLTAVLMSSPSDCFAIASPHQTEGHYSLYFSLFGRSLRAKEIARARVRLFIAVAPTEQDILKHYQNYLQEKQ
jgi:hypothetical protein